MGVPQLTEVSLVRVLGGRPRTVQAALVGDVAVVEIGNEEGDEEAPRDVVLHHVAVEGVVPHRLRISPASQPR